jgi:hypothetical protein
MSIYSTVDYLRAEGQKDGERRGLLEGACRQGCKLLLRHGKRRFGPGDDGQRALLEALADRLDQAQLERLQDRFLSARDWAELLAGVTAAGEPPARPEYLLPFEFDPTPLPPSIDQCFQVQTGAGESAVIHLRFQRIYQDNLGAVLHHESERLREQFGHRVETVVLVLWQGADGPAVTGEYRPPGGEVFRYRVTRLWEKDVDEMFHSCATAVFAPLARFPPERLPEVIRRLGEVIAAQAKDAEAEENLWGLTYCCMGLRYPAARVNELLAHVLPIVHRCKDTKGVLSDGYYAGASAGQAEGALQATRSWVLTLGGQRLGEAPPGVREAVALIRSVERLEQLAARALKAAAWQEVLAPN